MENTQRLQDLAAFVIATAKNCGATDADVAITIDQSVNVSVRNGDVEETQGAGDRQLLFRAFIGDKHGLGPISTADFKRRPLTKLVRDMVTLAKSTSADPSGGLPDSRFLATEFPKLDLFCPELAKVTQKQKLDMALAAAAAARDSSSLVSNAEASFNDSNYTYVYANSRGFCQGYSGTSCSLTAQAVVTKDSEMRISGWRESGRKLAKIGDPAAIGRMATERALIQIGARKVASQDVPVVFDPFMSARLIGQFAGATYGQGIQRKSSFLVEKLGKKVANDKVTIIDDPFMPDGQGSRPFGPEGLAQHKRTVVRNGVLECYMLDAYSARKLGTEPNGGGISNLYLEAGNTSPEDIIASVPNGLYLTSVSGPGFNPVNGDYSMGASGMWIENGKLSFPVAEITVAGNMLNMFDAIEVIGNDMNYRTSVTAPTLLISKMTVAGK
jgi:PmbA protein